MPTTINLVIDHEQDPDADPSTWSVDVDAAVDPDNGKYVLKNPFNTYAPDGGDIISTEVIEGSYFEAIDVALEERIKTNEKGGSGKYVLVVFDENLKNNLEAEIQAYSILAKVTEEPLKVSFNAYGTGWNIGKQLPVIDSLDEVNCKMRITGINKTWQGTKWDYSVTAELIPVVSRQELLASVDMRQRLITRRRITS
jgi:hypothetical protein